MIVLMENPNAQIMNWLNEIEIQARSGKWNADLVHNVHDLISRTPEISPKEQERIKSEIRISHLTFSKVTSQRIEASWIFRSL